ncbi:MAG: relaxase domain-containing protein [Lewinellaceae bacterium]|nr:relaxase domain-containing protein [Lewinellaceae bacterium]
MLRITVNKSAAAATKYFDEGLSKSDYYAEKGEITGKWNGKAAQLLNLKGEVSKENSSCSPITKTRYRRSSSPPGIPAPGESAMTLPFPSPNPSPLSILRLKIRILSMRSIMPSIKL